MIDPLDQDLSRPVTNFVGGLRYDGELRAKDVPARHIIENRQGGVLGTSEIQLLNCLVGAHSHRAIQNEERRGPRMGQQKVLGQTITAFKTKVAFPDQRLIERDARFAQRQAAALQAIARRLQFARSCDDANTRVPHCDQVAYANARALYVVYLDGVRLDVRRPAIQTNYRRTSLNHLGE